MIQELIGRCVLNEPEACGDMWLLFEETARPAIRENLGRFARDPHTLDDAVQDFRASNVHSGPGLFTARSAHPGGVHVMMMDGSVRLVGASIDLAVWRALGTRAGGEQVGNAF